jgi:hypothetical protein
VVATTTSSVTWGDWESTSSTTSKPVAPTTSTWAVPVAPASTSSSWGVAAYTGAPVAAATYTGAASLNKVEFGVIALMGAAALL